MFLINQKKERKNSLKNKKTNTILLNKKL